MTIQVKMFPHPLGVKGSSGIDQVVLAYDKYLPQFDVKIVHPDDKHFDLVAGHTGTGATLEHPFVCHVHGLHWSADYPCDTWQYYVNKQVIDSVRKASEVTVPSAWVAEPFQRDMRFTPHIIPHGIDAPSWEHNEDNAGYVLYNKNRDHDVCDSTAVVALAQRFPRQPFVTTFLPRTTQPMGNVNRIGKIPHDQMKILVQSSMVYLSTVKETFSIGVLEAMAAGVPVLGFDYGGNSFLVEHGRNGYLAKPGDFDDLAEGLKWCAKHRDALGKNGQEMARAWTWERAVEMVAGVYRLALEPKPPTVAVVIPCYNLGDKVGRAIESVRNQNLNRATLHSIIIVDDGSTSGPDIRSVVQRYAERDDRIKLVQKNNEGVAVARNTGIANSGAKYIACLDADDAIAPNFIEACVRELESDRSLGIAYTGLWSIRPSGQESLSKWPGEWNFDAHLQRHNQVPTACVFRREMWERLGGYKSRYCPSGAGEEDSEFWLRAGAYGYKAKKVTKEGLFIYSHQSGQVSGNPDHQRTDETAWHPWAGEDGDGKHPFASYATPDNHSHPVRQYDEPTISVIIPVGPGHEDKVFNALDSLEAQTFRQWEVIVVWDSDIQIPKTLWDAYHYVHFVDTGSYYREWTQKKNGSKDKLTYEKRIGGGLLGAGYARNRGAEIARAPLLLFLDADDWLYPQALEKMLYAWNEHQSIVYTDYINRAIVDSNEIQKLKSKGRWLATLKDFDDSTHLVVSASRSFDYDCERAQAQPQLDEKGSPYIWCTAMVLIPAAWHNEVGGFDETLKSWEDVDYHWRLAKLGKCYHRIAEELLVYNYHMGHRRERGRQTHEKLLYYISQKHKEIETVACRSCGKRPRPTSQAVSNRGGVFAAQKQQSQSLPGVDDNDFVLCWYMHGNTGNHQVIGATIHDKEIAGFNMVPKSKNPPGWSIHYGHRSGGRKEKFPVHRNDIAAQPHLFLPIEDRQAVAVPEVEKAPLPAPSSPVIERNILVQSSQAVAERLHTIPDRIGQNIAPGSTARPDINAPLQEQDTLILDTEKADISLPPEIATQTIDVEKVVSGRKNHPPVFELQKIPGVNVNIAKGLVAAGCKTQEDVIALGVKGLMAIKGVGEVKAKMILGAVRSAPKVDVSPSMEN